MRSLLLLNLQLLGVLWWSVAAASGRRPSFSDQLAGQEGGSLTFPVYHRQVAGEEGGPGRSGRGRRTLAQTAATNSTPSVESQGLQSKLITLDQPLGQYFAVFQVGTPPKEVAVIIDTGSELLWIQCEPCIACGIQVPDYPIFFPNRSSTYQSVSCDAATATCPYGDDSVSTDCTNDGACIFSVTYGDKSNSTGILSSETVTIPSTKGGSRAQEGIVFGCGMDNEGVESQLNASGLMGLDRGIFSVVSQLNLSQFSYCLPDRVQDVGASGYLTFGPAPSGSGLKYTPMLQNDASTYSTQFYYLNLTGVSVNGAAVAIPPSALSVDSNGNGGTIIDSGTSLTSFVSPAYAAVKSAFEAAVDPSLAKTDLGPDDTKHLCYQVALSAAAGAPAAPSVTLHFEGGVDLDLETDHLFRYVTSDTSFRYYCMAFNDAGSAADGGKNFIGNYQQMNFLVEYDIANSRLGFAPAQCSPSSSSSSSSHRHSASPPSLYRFTLALISASLTFFLIVL